MKLILNSHHLVICYELLLAINNVSKGSQKQKELKLEGKKNILLPQFNNSFELQIFIFPADIFKTETFVSSAVKLVLV